MDFSIKKYIKRVPKWLPWLFLFTMGFIIIIFNDAFGDNEPFIIISLLYFPLLSFLLVRWVFTQVRSIITLKNEKAKTELMHLKSQVNPHFFFNTLNNLYGLMDKDSKARNMVLKLSDLMRYSIYEGQKDWVTLGEELDYLKNYVELQEIRYHKKSDVQFNHQIESIEGKIMPLLFIILLENAFKHGLENLEKNAFIHINLSEHESKVNFEIENNFELQKASQEQGIGIKNLKRRLELVYPKKHSLTFDVSTDVYKVKLTLELK